MKNILGKMAAGLLAATILAGSAGSAAAAICGDLNNNGGRNVADVVLLFRTVLETPDPSPLCGGAGAIDCGDINADSNVTVNDVVILFSSVLGNETLYPLCTGPGNVISCPGGSATVSGTITTNQIWPSSCTILLDGTVFVEPGVVLTIQPGTTIKGKKNPSNPPPSALVFRRDSKINAVGTAVAPIVFTSDQAAGSRIPGDWGGLVMNGRAPVNCPGGECLTEGLSGTPFGGSEPNDSSGILRYVRVEFAGRILSTDNELNVLTMNGLGRGTAMDHVQAHMGLDDACEWFGGTVNIKYLVCDGAADDTFDYQLGTTAKVQFAFGQQTPLSLDAAGSNGWEGDNNENGFDFTPRSNPYFCNVTMIGCKGQGGNCNVDSSGALLRRGTAGQFWKSIVTGMGSRGMQLRDASTAAVACNAGPTLTGNLLFVDSMFWDNGSNGTTQCANHSSTNSGANCNSCQLFDLWKGQSIGPVVESDPGLSNASFPANPVPNGNASSSAVDCKTLDSFFDSTSYRGAFAPGGTNWLSGWTNFATN